ncbi:hypothetical protein EJ02DRAFT_359729 [Clathrospora elynae]|uniref:Uncharacterized protein n=1 Tax=Clathrospora elynae TaxID=706981 RepID=A0A6A5S670_9PLEO|nr:hypothetical protein EJ02DRAFT_359729 [Clathrospora elynae]
MRTPNRTLTLIVWPRYHPLLTTILLLLCIPVFFYHLVPSFTSATHVFVFRIASNMHPSSDSHLCTKEIGDAHCCGLFMDAEPCVDWCRQRFVDRETLRLTAEYETCADQCLSRYHDTCRTAVDTVKGAYGAP